jgi:hypothetical protein
MFLGVEELEASGLDECIIVERKEKSIINRLIHTSTDRESFTT